MIYPPNFGTNLLLLRKRRRRRERYASLANDNDVTTSERKRRKKLFLDVNEYGTFVTFDPKNTYWYKNYVLHPNVQCTRFQARFRSRFRLPYHSYISLLEMITISPYFKKWNVIEASPKKRKSSPISLLLLACLRYLGRGWTFDDLSEGTGISRDVHRKFFHQFESFGKEVLYPKYVKYPKTTIELGNNSSEFEIAGMHGAIGSMDACYVIIEKCTHRLKQNHLGGISKKTARSYNLTCNYRRQILHTTSDHPARWNDKTVVLYDELVRGLRNGSILKDNTFELLQKENDGLVKKVKYRGAYLLVDNGYLNWGNTIPPMKHTLYIQETRWSQWLESMRKDVECTFRIMKRIWRILKSGIRVHGVDIANEIWLTCCSLHNMLLEEDRLTVNWAGEAGLFGFDNKSDDIPFALSSLNNPGEVRRYDSSGMGPGYSIEADDSNEELSITHDIVIEHINLNEENEICFLTAYYFQSKLVENFDILFSKNEVKWPRRHYNRNRAVN